MARVASAFCPRCRRHVRPKALTGKGWLDDLILKGMDVSGTTWHFACPDCKSPVAVRYENEEMVTK